jgi:DNA-binding NarL/FixJ family response regulator
LNLGAAARATSSRVPSRLVGGERRSVDVDNGSLVAGTQKCLSPAALVALPAAETPGTSNGGPAGDVVRDLSRRELVILRTLTEGASNKVIALKLVITESTVKVHMKAILRKLRLQNRTQAAIWARTHLGELLDNAVI